MWEKLLMNVSCLSAIILSLIGFAKLPFKKFKTNHPKTYKATFFLLSLFLVAGGSIIAQLYVIQGTLPSWEFAVLSLGTGVVVFGGYQGYESTNLKNLMKRAFSALKTWLSAYSDSKIAKMIKKVGIEKIEGVAATLVLKTEQLEQQEEVVTTEKTQPTVTIEEKKEGE